MSVRAGAARLAAALLRVGLAGAVLATVAGWMSPLSWAFELATHFRLHVATAAAACLLLALLSRRPRAAAVALLLVLAQLPPLWPGLVPALRPQPAVAHPAGDAAALRVVQLNVQMDNLDRARAAAWLGQAEADVVVLVECDQGWVDAAAEALPQLGHRALDPRPDFLGTAIFSRYPISRIDQRVDGGLPWQEVTLELGGAQVRVAALHALPPVSTLWVRASDNLYAALVAEAPQRQRRAIVCGDFNQTPWSPTFRRLVQATGLSDAAVGRAPLGTWPAALPWPRLPIDHCLLSPDVEVADYAVGPDVGSDHLPIVVDLRLTDLRRP